MIEGWYLSCGILVVELKIKANGMKGGQGMAKKNVRNTRGKIVNAAWKLFYEQGYEDTTVEEIIELSRTSKGSFIII